ncbi:MAG: alpha-2-macroglobulin family protein [Planctomycetota bacterium]
MKPASIVPVAFACIVLAVSPAPARPGDPEWKEVQAAMEKGLPKTALERLEGILARALEKKAHPEAIRALATKISLEGEIQGGRPEEKIARMKPEAEKAPPEMRPVLEAILAHWYWEHFQVNRWRLLQRTQTAEPAGEDLATWDLPRVLAEIDARFSKALAAKDELRKIPIETYDELLPRGDIPDRYRPTLYDFLAHQALAFYAAGEQAGAEREDAFELLAESPIFAPLERFLAWEVPSGDPDSPTLKAIRLYEEILRFHLEDAEKSALLDADLARLRFGYNRGAGEEKDERYKAALRGWAEAHGDHELSALALAQLAEVLQAEGDLLEAHRAASEGKRRFPESRGALRCHNAIQAIEARSIEISTERVWNRPLPTIDVRYRNLRKVHFRLVAYDWEEEAKARGPWVRSSDRETWTRLLSKRPNLAWSAELPPTPDYKERVERLPAPEDVAPGSYFLFASADESFAESENNVVSATDIWVSDLAFVVRTRPGQGEIEGFVLRAEAGDPIEGAEVAAWSSARGKWEKGTPARTDANGMFRLKVSGNRSYALHVRHGGRSLATAGAYSSPAYDLRSRRFSRTVFFTDRSLYRPGQTISYKGIAIEVDREADRYEAIAGRDLTVILADTAGKEIERERHRTNDYGSFSGAFNAPRDRLLGTMSIRVDGEPAGQVSVRVEEYKRPKFFVALDPPEAAPKLDGEVHLKGTATAYTGAPIDGAKVRYRVVREVRYPPWWGWFYGPRGRPAESREIARGSATTAPDGTFEIRFVARPDRSVDAKEEPVFRFRASADVTDAAGETRSGERIVAAGYTALAASLAAESWQVAGKPVEISVRTESLDGVGEKADGVVRVYRLREPEKVARPPLGASPRGPRMPPGDAGEPSDPSDPNSWPLGEAVAERGFTTDAEGNASLSLELRPGAYRAVLETLDRFGKPVAARLPIRVLDPSATRHSTRVPFVLDAPAWSVEPGSEFVALWGSGYEPARAFVEIEHRRKLIQAYWTPPGATQATIRQAVTGPMRGGFTLRVTMVRENRAYLESRRVEVPWTDKDLEVRWERFTSRLEPGAKETWTAVVSGRRAEKLAAEMVAALYDASLDAYLPHAWPRAFGVFRADASNPSSQFENRIERLQLLSGGFRIDWEAVPERYRDFPPEIAGGRMGYFGVRAGLGARGVDGRARARSFAAPGRAEGRGAGAAPLALEDAQNRAEAAPSGAPPEASKGAEPERPPVPPPDLQKISARANLTETAFFFPHLLAGKDGEVRMEFTMPEALTEWRFLGFAHDRELRSGWLEGRAVTAKELMVQPNPPRFLREGDVLEFTVKISNQSAARQEGKVRLSFSDARTGEPADRALGLAATDLAFEVPSKESRSYSWRLEVPDGLGFLVYKAVASTGRLSDGEEGFLPVLPRRILVRESLALSIRGPGTRAFDFEKLRRSGESETARHVSLSVQVASNPSWYAVLALPYLMECPYECTEQVFNRLYANSLARHIATSDPKIRRVFEAWRGTAALESTLEKNEDLKAVSLEETPWVRDAEAESQARRRVGLLFDENRLADETGRAFRKLAELQRPDGAWSWFPGGPRNDYITLYIVTGFGRLRHLGVRADVSLAVKALPALDAWMDGTYREILRTSKPDDFHLSPTAALYLYGRSFFLEDRPVEAKHKDALEHFLGQARRHWVRLGSRQSQGHLALALKRFGDRETPGAIVRSLRERSVSDEELGMFWRDEEASWWWHRAPVETQALMVEVFDEVASDPEAVEALKVWLLQAKRTRDWKTTKATADAVYALLLRGAHLLASDALVEVALGGEAIRPERAEAGTGFYERRFSGAEVRPEMGSVALEKSDAGIAWGGIHWQYLEDVAKVSPHEATPLRVKKALYKKVQAAKGPVLEPVRGPLAVGDELVARIEIRVDRDMEYVHLKDGRGSGTEPANVLSSYRYRDGLAYYESTRDTASHFFIDYLPKGTYVFESSARVVHRGAYQSGIAEIQCMYAPEFGGHSESIRVEVR